MVRVHHGSLKPPHFGGFLLGIIGRIWQASWGAAKINTASTRRLMSYRCVVPLTGTMCLSPAPTVNSDLRAALASMMGVTRQVRGSRRSTRSFSDGEHDSRHQSGRFQWHGDRVRM